ncbi:hypothetical protein KKF34_15940 [Myxococcota bacterium]|nr:hypothetical protein [Myxococcota bacterium]MBU1380438.1 hypothetical protein [Myxococcota bacterium]MBU1498368.1 hypothetical protein [Myxococcota bacterium]
MFKTGIIGGGIGGLKILNILKDITDIRWIADINDDAPGIIAAKEQNIGILKDFRSGIADTSLELTIECTGNEKVLSLIEQHKHSKLSVISSTGALLLVNLVEQVQKAMEKQKQANELEKMFAAMTEVGNKVRYRSDSVIKEVRKIMDSSKNLRVGVDVIEKKSEITRENIKSISNSTEILSADAKTISERSKVLSTLTGNASSSIESAVEWVHRVENAAEGMDSIIKSIMEITRMTQLIAVNASIQAALAGEAGKGFAVLAEEVKILSDQTKEASIKANREIAAMNHSTSGTTTEIRNIFEIIEKINIEMKSVSTSAEDQSLLTQKVYSDINDSQRKLDEVSEEISTSSKISQAMILSLNQIYSQMTDLIKETESFR